MPNADIEDKRRAAREVIDILAEMSLLLVRPAHRTKGDLAAVGWCRVKLTVDRIPD